MIYRYSVTINPPKILLKKKKNGQPEWPNPNITGSAHIVFQLGQYLNEVKYYTIPSWPYGGLC